MIAFDNHVPSSLIPSPADLELVSICLGGENPVVLCTVHNPPNCQDHFSLPLALIHVLLLVISVFQTFVGTHSLVLRAS